MSASPPSSLCAPPRWITRLVVTVAAVVFLPVLQGGFVADDFVYIARFRELPWAEWPRLFFQEWSGGVWGEPLREVRPFAALSFMGDARAFGASGLGYRLSNLALHVLSTATIVRLAWLYSRGVPAAALIAGLIFAVHPAHVEAVAWITGRVDLIATTAALLFWLAAELYAERGQRPLLGLAALALFLGVFAKEFCNFAPLLLLLRWALLDLRAGRTVWLRRAALLGASALTVLAFALCRRVALGHDTIVGYNLWTDLPAWHRQASYAGWLVPLLPFQPHAEWQSFPSLGVLHGVWIFLAVAVVAGLALALHRRARIAAAALFFGGIWYFLTVAPLTAVVYHSPRHLYFPTVGLALAIGLACGATRLRIAVGAALIAWCAAGHFAALQPWKKAGEISRDALAALDRALAEAGPDAVAITSVPARLGPAWLWAWSSPQNVSATFLENPPVKILEHPVTYSRGGGWFEIRQPLETVRAAKAIAVLHVDASGTIACRAVPVSELPACAESLAQIIARGISPESWDAWVKSISAP